MGVGDVAGELRRGRCPRRRGLSQNSAADADVLALVGTNPDVGKDFEGGLIALGKPGGGSRYFSIAMEGTSWGRDGSGKMTRLCHVRRVV